MEVRQSSRTFIVAILIIVAIIFGGFFLFGEKTAAPTVEEAATDYEVSFMCADDTHFIAAFTNRNTLRVIIDGTTTHEFPRLAEDQHRYGDGDYTYAFAGEQAFLMHANGATTTCAQPFDDNNAPFNFGDA